MSELSFFIHRLVLTFFSLLSLYHCLRAPYAAGSVLEHPRWRMWCLTLCSLVFTGASWFQRSMLWVIIGAALTVLAFIHLRSRIIFNANGFSLMGLFRPRRYSYGDIVSITAHEAGSFRLTRYGYRIRVGWDIRPLAWSWGKRSDFLNLADMAYRRAHGGKPIPGRHIIPPHRKKRSRNTEALLSAGMIFLLLLPLAIYAGYPVGENQLTTRTASLLHINDHGGRSLTLDFGMKDVLSLYRTDRSSMLLTGIYTEPFTLQTHGQHIVTLTDADGIIFLTRQEFNTHRLHALGIGLMLSAGAGLMLYSVIRCATPKHR